MESSTWAPPGFVRRRASNFSCRGLRVIMPWVAGTSAYDAWRQGSGGPRLDPEAFHSHPLESDDADTRALIANEIENAEDPKDYALFIGFSSAALLLRCPEVAHLAEKLYPAEQDQPPRAKAPQKERDEYFAETSTLPPARPPPLAADVPLALSTSRSHILLPPKVAAGGRCRSSQRQHQQQKGPTLADVVCGVVIITYESEYEQRRICALQADLAAHHLAHRVSKLDSSFPGGSSAQLEACHKKGLVLPTMHTLNHVGAQRGLRAYIPQGDCLSKVAWRYLVGMYEDPTHFGDGGYGSTLSHILAWSDARAATQPTLILESDAKLHRHFADSTCLALTELRQTVGEEWDLLWLGTRFEGAVEYNDAAPLDTLLVRPPFCLVSCAYIISPRGAAKALQALQLAAERGGQLLIVDELLAVLGTPTRRGGHPIAAVNQWYAPPQGALVCLDVWATRASLARERDRMSGTQGGSSWK